MWQILFSAIALVFVIEGIIPFLCPDCYRKLMKKMTKQQDQTLRIMGLVSMLFGVVILYIIHHHLLG